MPNLTTDTRGGDGHGTKSLFRSLIDHNGQPSAENLKHNYERLRASGLLWVRPDDARLWAWISAHYETHGGAPNVALLTGSFPDDVAGADLEVAERVKDVLAPGVPIYIRTNFAAKLQATLAEQRDIRASAILAQAKDILSKRTGVEVGTGRAKKTLKGFDDFASYLTDEIARLRSETTPDKTVALLEAGTLSAPLPPPVWTCEGLRLSPLVGVVMLAGYGDSGKSIVAQHIALCVASGKPIFGLHHVTQGRVLHLDYEQGQYLTIERYQRLSRGMGLDIASLAAEDRLRVGVFPKEKLDDKGVDEILAATIKGFDVVIIDSNRAASPSTDENSSEARVPLDMISRVCAGKVLPLIIHHARKPTQEGKRAGGGPRMAIRGSSSLFDALGGCYVFEGGKDRSERVSIYHEKERLRGVRLEPFAFKIDDVPNDGDPRWGLRVHVLSAEDAANSESTRAEFQVECRATLKVIVDHPDWPFKKIRQQAGFGDSKGQRCIQHLIDTDHIVERDGRVRGRTVTIYRAQKDSYDPPVTRSGLGVEAVNDNGNRNPYTEQSAEDFMNGV